MALLISRVQQILRDLGLRCILAFPLGEMPRLQIPLFVLRTESETLRCPGGGTRVDTPDGSDCRGWEFTGVVAAEVYAPYLEGGAACEEVLQSVITTLPKQLEGSGLTEIRLAPVTFDPDVDCFRSTIYLTFCGCMYWKEEREMMDND